LREIREGEEKLANQRDESHRQELRAMLGLQSSVRSSNPPEEKVAPPTSLTDPPPKRKRSRRVGQRGPNRDRVGREENGAE
jgi:hypothetical protein